MTKLGRWRLRVLLVAAGLVAVTTAQSSAQVNEQVVYWPVVTDGTEYRRVVYPAEAGPLLVLAETEVVVEARRAPVSYWPISREYLADLSGEPRIVEGTLEILDRSGAITVVEPEPYVLWYPAGAAGGPTDLVHGEAAAPFYQDYVQRARAAADRLKQYQRIVAEHRAAVEAWVRMAAERRGKDMPPPPPELNIQAPELYQAFATEPREAFIVSVPEGAYTVRFRGPDGQIVPGSQRTIVSFGPLERGVGYVLRPENRWTQPAVSFAPNEMVYTTGGTDLFFQPVPVVKYAAEHFTRLFRPQSVEAADPSLTMWVPGEDDSGSGQGAALALWNGDHLVRSVPQEGYRVAQLPGSSRGYEIEEFTPEPGTSLKPDFTAMRVAVAPAATKVSLAQKEGGQSVDGSERQIRLVDPPAEPLLFLPALLPLAIGAALHANSGRRRRVGVIG